MKRITNKILALLVAPLLAVGCIEESKPESSVMNNNAVVISS